MSQASQATLQKLLLRSGVATAAAVGVTGVATNSANAAIFYSGQLDQVIDQSSGQVFIDVDNDSTNDLLFYVSDTFVQASYAGNLPPSLVAPSSPSFVAAQFAEDDLIDASSFSGKTGRADRKLAASDGFGEWLNNSTGYLGFQLGSGNFGWALLTASIDEIILHSYAYDDSGAGILAGAGATSGGGGGSTSVPEPTPLVTFAVIAGLLVKNLAKFKNKSQAWESLAEGSDA